MVVMRLLGIVSIVSAMACTSTDSDVPADCEPLDCTTYVGQCGAAMDDGCGGSLDCRDQCGSAPCDTSSDGTDVAVCCAEGQVIATAGSPLAGDCCTVTAIETCGPPVGSGCSSCGPTQVCVSGNLCCEPTAVETACDLKCGVQSRGCGVAYDCGISHCPGTCNDGECTCSFEQTCQQFCAMHTGAPASTVQNPCGGTFNCPACPGGGGG